MRKTKSSKERTERKNDVKSVRKQYPLEKLKVENDVVVLCQRGDVGSGAQFSSSLEIRSSARDVQMVESNETENWYSRVRSTWRSNGISYTTCMQYFQVALFTYNPINSLV